MLRAIADGKCSEISAAAGIMEENKRYIEERSRLLAENGYPTDYLDPPPHCPLCSDTGFADGKLCSCMTREMTLLCAQ